MTILEKTSQRIYWNIPFYHASRGVGIIVNNKLIVLCIIIALLFLTYASAMANLLYDVQHKGNLEQQNVGDDIGVNINVEPYAQVEFTANNLFTDPLEGHTGLYWSDGNITRDRARRLWNDGQPFETEKKVGSVARFDIRTNTEIKVSIESFREDDLKKAEYNWLNSPTYFVVSDRDDNWAERAAIYSGGYDTPDPKTTDEFDITLEPGAHKERFNVNAAVWIQDIDQQLAGNYIMPLYVIVESAE